MPSRAATIYWGWLAVIGAALPVAALQNPPTGQSVPAPAEPRTQESVWTRPITAPAPRHLTFTERALVTSGAETPLQALALPDGAPRWTTSWHSTFAPVVAGSLMIVPTKDAVAAVSLADGATVWTQSLRAAVPPIADAACVFVAGGTEIVQLRVADGSIVARATLPAAATGGLATAGDAVFVVLEDRTLLRLVASTLTTVWRAPLEGIGTSILAAYDRLYIPLANGGLAAHAQDSGDFQWMASSGFPITGVAAGQSRVYLAQLDTSLRALHADNGHQVWREVAPRRMELGPFLIGTRLCAGLVDGVAACWNLSGEGTPPGKPALLPVPDTPDSGPPLAPRLHALAASADGLYVARVLSNFETQWWLTLVRRVDGTAAR